MGRHLAAVLSAAAIAAAFGLSGCSGDEQDASPETAPPSTSASLSSTAAAQAAPLPPPDALAAVLYRLADPAVPGTQKLSLVEGATLENAGAFDQFANALLNGGYAPVKFDARDIGWSDRDPADVIANVNVSSPNPGGPRFSFPMEFKPYQGGWQLSARTAEVLLAFRTEPVAPPVTPSR
jgi:alpha-beta hydrolase superfamily lysophospholipase